MIEAMSAARRSAALVLDLPVDAVASCVRAEEGWQVVLDVIESAARMGDNDLLATYELRLSAGGEVTGFNRTGRYHRDDAAKPR